VAFELDEAALDGQVAETPVNTKLTLNVPSEAQVFLAGNETSMTGSVREFATAKLAQGEQWPNYEVRVTLQVDGRTLTKSQSITLEGGQPQELSFQFDEPQVAELAEAAR
jgi:uncharacterized protein (TIGR03000 family)